MVSLRGLHLRQCLGELWWGGALRGGWDQRKFGLVRREQGSSPSRFETLPTTSNGSLADR